MISCAGRDVEVGRPRPGVVARQRPAGFDDGVRVVARHLADEPRHVAAATRCRCRTACGTAAVEVPAVARGCAATARRRPAAATSPGPSVVARHSSAVACTTIPATSSGWRRVSSSDSGPPIEYPTAMTRSTPSVRHDGGGVVGHVLELEPLRRAQPAAVATVVDADDVVLGAQRPVGGDELEVARRRPAVQQQDRGPVGVVVAVVADEELAATLDAHDQSGWGPRQVQQGHGFIIRGGERPSTVRGSRRRRSAGRGTRWWP